ncbi:MAG: hypothetical protein DRP71_15645, partial [Verrucomicrobia bacterium]
WERGSLLGIGPNGGGRYMDFGLGISECGLGMGVIARHWSERRGQVYGFWIGDFGMRIGNGGHCSALVRTAGSLLDILHANARCEL